MGVVADLLFDLIANLGILLQIGFDAVATLNALILSLPWCWYDDVPHDLSVLKSIVQGGQPASGCTGIEHSEKVPYLTYSKGSLYKEVREQFPELFGANINIGGTEYVRVRGV